MFFVLVLHSACVTTLMKGTGGLAEGGIKTIAADGRRRRQDCRTARQSASHHDNDSQGRIQVFIVLHRRRETATLRVGNMRPLTKSPRASSRRLRKTRGAAKGIPILHSTGRHHRQVKLRSERLSKDRSRFRFEIVINKKSNSDWPASQHLRCNCRPLRGSSCGITLTL